MTGVGLCVKLKTPAYLTLSIKSYKKYGNINPLEKFKWVATQKFGGIL